MTKRKPTDWREARRFRAWELKEEGWSQSDIAAALGVTRGAVSQWFKKAERDGVEALGSRKGGGPKPRLSAEQLQQLPAILEKGPEANGFRGDVWTRPRVGKVIAKEFGVRFTPQHVGNLLRQIGWNRQKPVQRASQREEEAIQEWRSERWPELKKKPDKRGAP